MLVYRIAKSEKRARDISGMGAFKEGGRWNNPGTYMLYTSENSSLAYLENLVYFEAGNIPPDLYLTGLHIREDSSLIYTLPDKDYPKHWQEIGNLENKSLGDSLMEKQQFIAIKVRSAVNKFEYNYLLNPLFPGYHHLVKIESVEKLAVDARLVK
ncbi:RES family NAD+ phosphorylase [Pedobacter sp. BS3]|uniref:RES family NAD+ phosphorylase n=1 Tax=Pedobacter sp. BS3 TaxID=2567937 RepID=UPI0011EE6BCA|nr:RES family NAD+ phosphorylase [Pedobacter sp. BS3]TZF81473.1 RES family NAD+ phosphorylase [Pedobacter sp. BS3]